MKRTNEKNRVVNGEHRGALRAASRQGVLMRATLPAGIAALALLFALPAARAEARTAGRTASLVSAAAPRVEAAPWTSVRRDAQQPCFLKRVGRFFRRAARSVGRAFRRVGRAFRRVVRRVGTAFKKAGRNIRKGFKKVGRGIRRGFKKFGQTVKKGVKKAGKFFKKVGKGIKKGFKKVGQAIKKGVKKVGQFVKKVGKAIGKGFKAAFDWVKKNIGKIKDILCATVGLGICTIIKIVKQFAGFVKLVFKKGLGGAFKELWRRFKAKVKREIKYFKDQTGKMFQGFRKIMVMKKFSLKAIERFARTVVKGVKNLVERFNKNIGIPKLLATVIGWITAAPLYPAVIGGVTPIAAINFGFRKLMKWILPKIILGTGGAFKSASQSKGGKIFGKILKGLLKLVGAGGGLIFKFIKDPKMKEKIRRIFLRVADVSGKINKGIAGAMKIAEQVRTGSFESIESALKQQATLPTKLGPEDLKKVVAGLMDFGRDQIWLKLSPLLRRLLTKAISLLDRFIDIPRNALVGAVGTIPFAGGAIAAALNFGLGILIQMVKDFLIDGVIKMAEILFNDTWKDIQNDVTRKLVSSRGARAKTGKFIEFVQTVGKLAGDVSKAMSSAAKGLQGTIGTLVSAALEKFILRGIRNPDVRKILADAVGTVVGELAKGRGFNLTGAVIKVLQKIKDPLASLVARPIKNTNLRNIVQRGLATLLGSLASNAGVKKIMKNPLGFLTEVGVQLIGRLKNDIANLILGRIANPQLRNVVAAAIGTLTSTIERGGFAALLPFSKLLGKLYAGLKQPVLNLLLSGVKHPGLRSLLERGVTFVLSEIESKGLSGVFSSGIGGFFVRLFERIKDPLVDLLLTNVSSPLLRDGAKRAIDAIIAKAKAGKLSELLNFKKVLADVVRFLKPTIVEFIAGRFGDPGLKQAMSAAVGPAVDRVAGMFQSGSFKGLVDVLVMVAEPALQALKTKVVAALPGAFKGMIGQAFDKVIPMLRTAEGRSRLLREGPRMLWSAVVSYLRSLYEKAKTFVANKVNQVREAIFKVIDGIRGSLANIGTTLRELGNLGNLLQGVRLPSPT